MTPAELVALAMEEKVNRRPRCKICDGPYREHVDALLDAGFGQNQVERLMLEKVGWRVYASTIGTHRSHRGQPDA